MIFLGHGKANSSKGLFSEELAMELSEAGGGCRGYSLELADINGDGRDELIAGFAGERTTGVTGMTESQCKSSGRLGVWQAIPKG